MTENIPTYPDLAGKVAVVTGGSGGIGAAACRLLDANGARVAVHGRDEARIAAVVDEIDSNGGQAIGVSAEVTDFAAIERMRERVEGSGRWMCWPYLPPAVAPFRGRPLRSPRKSGATAWRALTSAFLTLKSFLPGMIERGRGSVVIMASSAGRVPTHAPTAYSAAKAGVVMLSRKVAEEVGPRGVRVNCLAPDSVLTERTRSYMTYDQLLQWAETFPPTPARLGPGT